ncbi:hypothetical protein [Alicyclobacillus sendaiensis]|uniref:Glycosyltransferase RgtA/B/C/D-like domain-containing protein n=1 Tax=Alicyclobacillus sendaiensis PA2 TaxID=3029425 RepID=A0ABT6XZC8_ALISE|nr:hypothetical protein [Alicyclobacillus sendaiensis]MDI9260340.1 hypothetical protein [Alicyclobacillus sendaiensis PA2]
MARVASWLRLDAVILLGWLLYFAYAASAPLSDPDTPWHLATGAWILAHHHVPTHDPFSWSMRGQPWVTQEWLFEVVLAWCAHHFGFPGVYGILVGLQTLTVWFVYRLCLHLSRGNAVFSAIAAALAVAAGMPFWVVRPQLVSYMMFALFLLLLERVRRGSTGYAFLLIPLTLVWANAHASVSIGIAMILFEVLVSFLPTIGRFQGQPLPMRTRALLIAIAAACVGVGLLNPNGIHEFTYALLSNNALMVNSINEWHSPNFHSEYYKYGVIPFLMLIALVAIARSRKLPWKYVLYFFACFALTLVYQRFMPYLAIAGAPLIALLSFDWLRVLLRPRPVLRFVWLAAMLGEIVDFGLRMPSIGGPVSAHMNPNAYPVAAVDYLKSHSIPGPLLNAYDFGGYLIYRGVPTFVDGRTDIYLRSGVFANYMDLQNLAPDAPALLQQYHFQSAILPPGYSLTTYLENNPNWTLVYSDNVADIFVRNASTTG